MGKPKVVILCGGLGTRLREETEFKPKPMVHIGNRPILWHIMKIYSHYGFDEFILCLGYKGEVIKEYFYNYEVLNNDFSISLGKKRSLEILNFSSNDNWKITVVDTGENTLKGARIKRIEKYIDGDTFMLTYGDGVADININKLLDFHRKQRKIGTVTGVRPPSLFGELQVNRNKVTHFSEKPQTSTGLINGGFFVFSVKFFEYLSEDPTCDFEHGPLERLTEDGELMVYEHTGSWECMDTFRDNQYLNKLWEEKKAFWKVWD